MRASARVILRVTKVSPRIGLSWLKRMPLHAIHPVGLAVVHGDPVGVELGRAIRRARIEGRGLASAASRAPCRTARKWTPGRSASSSPGRGCASPRGAAACRAPSEFGGVLRLLEGDRDVALRGEVVDLVGLRLLDHARQARGIGHVAVVQEELDALLVRILVQVVDAGGVEHRGAALDAVDHVALVEQELGQVGAVLPGDAGDERDFLLRHFSVARVSSVADCRP